MAGRIYLTSFQGTADRSSDQHNSDWLRRQQKLHESALTFGGVDEMIAWDSDRLAQTEFAKTNAGILNQPRGCGYWLWKPFIIREALSWIAEDDYLVYHDVGRSQLGDEGRGYTIERDLGPLLRWTDQHQGIYPGVYIAHHGKQQHWTKRDCFLLMDCDTPEYWGATQVQATHNIWKNTARVREFVDEWLDYCTDPRILTDTENQLGQENLPGFVEHRHDQSVLTNLCVKHGVKAYGSAKQVMLLPRNINSVTRHLRAEEIAATGGKILRQLVSNMQVTNFDSSMIRWIELYYCDRRYESLDVLLVGEHSQALWQRYFPNARIDIHAVGSHGPDTGRLYDLAIINDPGRGDRQKALLLDLYTSLNIGAILICGPVKKAWDSDPSGQDTSLGLMRGYWKNKVVRTPSMSDSLAACFDGSLLTAFTGWGASGQRGNVYFIRHESAQP